MKTPRSTVLVFSLVVLALFAAVPAALANPVSPLSLSGLTVAGAPVSFTARVAPNSTVRIVVIAGGIAALGAQPVAQGVSLGCYTGAPAALGTADATADASGNVGPIVVWASALPGTYRALLLQGPCDSARSGRTTLAATDEVVLAQAAFTIGDSVPALSPWGLAVMGLALSIAGWAFLSRTRA